MMMIYTQPNVRYAAAAMVAILSLLAASHFWVRSTRDSCPVQSSIQVGHQRQEPPLP